MAVGVSFRCSDSPVICSSLAVNCGVPEGFHKRLFVDVCRWPKCNVSSCRVRLFGVLLERLLEGLSAPSIPNLCCACEADFF